MSANDTHQERTGQCQLDSASTPFSLEPSLFPLVKLHLCARILNGGTPKSNSEYWNGEVPFVTPPDLRDLKGGIVSTVERTLTSAGVESGSNTISKGVIISGRAPVGYVGIVDSPSAFNQGCKGLESEHEHRFLSYVMVASSGNLNSLANGTTFLELSTTSLENYRIPLPPLETQQRIADYLDAETGQIDTTVSTLDELIEEMKSRRIELVRSSTRFDGESNKRTVPGVSGREREENTKGRLGLLSSTVRRGISPSYSTSGLPVVNQKCIRPNGEFDPEFLRHHKEEKNPVQDELLVQAGDILINSTGTGTLGRSCLMSEVPHRLAFDSHVTLVRPRADKILPEYLGWVVESEEERLIRLSVGSTNQIELSRGTVFNLEFYYPSQEVQKEICTFLDIETAKIDKIISTATELRSELLARRSALITEVVTGKRQV